MPARQSQIRFVAKFIATNPGCSRSDIADGCHLNTQLVGDILEHLREQQEIHMTGSTRSAVYEAVSLREKVIRAIRFHAGATRAFLAENLEEDPKRVGYVLQAMTREGDLLRVGEFRGARYFHPRYHHRHHDLRHAS